MKKYALTFLAALVGAGACLAQTPEPAKFYKLEFVVKEVEGTKVFNSRTYTTLASDGSGCSIRAGSKVPVQITSKSSTGEGTPSATTVPFSIVDIGVNIDCSKVKEVEAGLSMVVTAEANTIPQDAQQSGSFPISRQNRWNATLVVPLKKPTLIFSSDDMTSKHQMQVELTATPIR